MKKLLQLLGCISVLFFFISCSNQVVYEVEKDAELVNNIESHNPKENPTFAIVYPVAHPFFESVTISAKETAELLGVNIIIRAPATATVKEQIQIMNNLIQQEVDGIAIGPTDSVSLTPFINKAIDMGINVICFDTDAPESNRISYIGTDNLSAGEHLGEVVARLIDYEGSIIVSTGLSSMLNLSTRVEGLQNIINNYPNIEIKDIRSSDGIPSKTMSNIEEMISDYPEFKALVGIDSLSGPAAVTVWKAKGINNKVSVTFDDLPMTIDGVINNQISSTISQSQFTWGTLIVERLYEAHQGIEIPKLELTETMEVNGENVKEYISNSKGEEN
ncbi:substrate-binding domain-containing protein [Evansella sp. AB-rgal1]|uniref:substrate-binding domain-containing protein n=1 Tax=Evansella sp. AB-rgal1 TaxID=3242696 RepID=UPI00359D390E